MANPCAGLDPTWAHLPAPAPIHTAHAAAGHCHSTSSWLFPAAAFENEALTSALRASMLPANANANAASSSYPTTPSSSSTSSASDLLSGGHGAPAPATRPGPQAARFLGGTKAGRVTKRKPRPSGRPPITYITADPANFRRMVQEVTGFPVASSGVRLHDAAALDPASTAAPSWPTTPPMCMLPTLDTSAFLLDRAVSTPARVPEDKSSSGGASPAMAVKAVEDDDSSVLRELEASMACAPAFVSDDFPTLESWGII